MAMLYTFLTGTLLSSVFVFVMVRLLRGDISKTVAEERSSKRAEIEKIDQQIEANLDQMSDMSPRSDLVKLKSELKQIEDQLVEELKHLEEEEETVKKLQKEIDEREQKHNEHKLGKEDSKQVAEQLSLSLAETSLESETLAKTLTESRDHLQTLLKNAEKAGDAAAVAGLQAYKAAAEETAATITEVEGSRSLATERYLELQKQYQEMETAYKNLVEKQLAGT